MTPGSVVLRLEVGAASEVIARQLEIEPGSPVVTVERVRTADGEPMALERAYLSAGRFPGLETVDLTDASLYERLAERFGVQVAVADQWVSAIRLSDGEARLLGVPPDQPAILFQRVTRDPGGAVVEYSRSLFRGDRYEVHTRHRRPGVAAPEPPRREVPEALPRRGHVGCRSGQGAFV
jgi:GntR family transcriptional regulator